MWERDGERPKERVEERQREMERETTRQRWRGREKENEESTLHLVSEVSPTLCLTSGTSSENPLLGVGTTFTTLACSTEPTWEWGMGYEGMGNGVWREWGIKYGNRLVVTLPHLSAREERSKVNGPHTRQDHEHVHYSYSRQDDEQRLPMLP